MPRPSIVPIALTVDDRTGYTLWAPPWEEDGEEWQAFLGTTEDDTAKVHLFPTPAALASFCRSRTDHDLADHPVWPVVTGLGAEDLTPDDDHRYDLDGVYDIAAENPDRWAVEELAATIDIVGRLAECLDTGDEDTGDEDTGDQDTGDQDTGDQDTDEDDDEAEGQFEAVAELVGRPEVGSLGLGVEAFAGRSGEDAWVGVGGALDELWEDVVEELSVHLDWTGGGTVSVEDYPAAGEADEDAEDAEAEELDEDTEDAVVATPVPAAPATGVRTIGGGSRITASAAAVAAAQEFWEEVGILPVELVVPGAAGVTLRCYVEDVARFLGHDGEIWVFDTPTDLAKFLSTSTEDHDLTEIASWPEVADSDTLPLPGEQDRYDLTELTEVLGEVADGAAGLLDVASLAQPVEGARDIAEYARLSQVEALLSPSSALGRAVALGEREPGATLRAEDAAAIKRDWDQVVTAVTGALVWRD